jgi:hypothetical protein
MYNTLLQVEINMVYLEASGKFQKLFFFFSLTCLHKRGEEGFELVTFASLGMVPAD